MVSLIATGILAAATAAATAYSEHKKSEAAKDAKEEARKNAEEYTKWAQNLINQVTAHNATINGYGSSQDVQNYKDAVSKTDYLDMYNKFWDKDGDGIADDPSEFEYNKSVEDFLNPNRDKLVGEIAKKTQGMAAGAGMGRSYDGAMAVGRDIADKNEQLYANALTQYNGDREFAYKSWSDYLTQKRNQYNDLIGAVQGNNNQLKDLADAYLKEQQDEFSNLINAQMAAQGVVVNGNNTVAQTGNYTTDYGAIVGNGVNAFGTMYQATAKPTSNSTNTNQF